ncbi:MAG: hypothetical protein A2514_10630 [Gammaproteobacteria bacterium RIFOXYD12_FULL_61_37]|nr:MAG: hypothetical protein A2514_10630 [Gammaproteobacteria bacterium RIFOXYD12_FULL_61_37]
MKPLTPPGNCSRPFEPKCRDFEVLVALLSRFSSDFASGTDRATLFDRLLSGLMMHTESAYGFIGEYQEVEGALGIRLRIHALRLLDGDGDEPLIREAAPPEEFNLLPESLIEGLFKSRMPVISNQSTLSYRLFGPLPGAPSLDNFLGIPLLIRDQVSGLVAIGNREGGYDRALAVHLAPLANSMAALIEADRHAVRAYFDPLTGLPNELVFIERFNTESSRHVRRRLPLSLLRLEIDHFNNYRNNHGPTATEACIKRIAEILSHNLRAEDCVVRTGPGQFAALLSETPSVRAVVVAEKLRQAITRSPIQVEGIAAPMSPSVSVGIVTQPAEGRSLNAMMEAASQALQQAKASGGNQVSAGSFK